MGKIISFVANFKSSKDVMGLGSLAVNPPAEVVAMPGDVEDARLGREWDRSCQSTAEKSDANPGDWGWEVLVRIQNYTGLQEEKEALELAKKAEDRQIELADLIQAQYGKELRLPMGPDLDVLFPWLYEHVEELRSRSPLFEEYYWLSRKMDFKKAEEVRQRGLRLVG